MNKSVVVLVEVRHWVNKYKTWQASLRKHMAHDATDTCNVGDIVKIEQLTQKISARKAFFVTEVLKREKIVLKDSSVYDPSKFKQKKPWALLPLSARAAIEGSVEHFYSDHGLERAANINANSTANSAANN